jgi:SSS family solute:Na+ symporter
MTVIIVIICYLALLLGLGLFSGKLSRGTSKDFFVASHSIGPFLLLMSVFGTTMTAFALVGSTGESFERGIGVYGLMASMSGFVHAAVFFIVGIKVWRLGFKHGFITQIQLLRARFESSAIGYVLFPVLVMLVVPYLLIGVIGAGKTIQGVTAGLAPDLFGGVGRFAGAVPIWLSGLVICLVVLAYVFAGGSRGAAFANTFQTLVFMAMGIVAFFFIVRAMGGLSETAKVPARIVEGGMVVQEYAIDEEVHRVKKLAEPIVVGKVTDAALAEKLKGKQPHFMREEVSVTYKKKTPAGELVEAKRDLGVNPLTFLTYLFIPLSVGMFPHLFQHWLTAKSAKSFRLTVVAHPLCILVVWVPCVLIGAWASGLVPWGLPPAAVLSFVLNKLVDNQILVGLLTAGVLAAIMSSLDSQFLCLGTMFTNDIVVHAAGKDRFSDKQVLWIARIFIIGIVALTYWLALVFADKGSIFDLAIWCFSGFAALFPIIFAALYWKRTTLVGVYCSLAAAVSVWLFYFIKSGGHEITIAGGLMPVTVCVLASAAALVIGSLVSKRPSDEAIRKFFPTV